MEEIVAYYRISKPKVRDGVVIASSNDYSIMAQEEVIKTYALRANKNIIAEFVEVETGKNDYRPELLKAFALCRERKARLVISRLDRLSRNASFILQLQDSDVNFTCANNPDINSLTVGILAIVAQNERETISARTKLALAQRVKMHGEWRKNKFDIEAIKASHASRKRVTYKEYEVDIMFILSLRKAGWSRNAIIENYNQSAFAVKHGKLTKSRLRNLYKLDAEFNGIKTENNG